MNDPAQEWRPCWRGECRRECYYPETCTTASTTPDLLGPQIGAEGLRQERDDAYKAFTIAKAAYGDVLRDRNRERNRGIRIEMAIEAAIAPWPPGPRKGDVYRALGGE